MTTSAEDPTPPDVRYGEMAEAEAVSPADAPTEVREVETKLRVHALFRLPDLTQLPGVSTPCTTTPRIWHCSVGVSRCDDARVATTQGGT